MSSLVPILLLLGLAGRGFSQSVHTVTSVVSADSNEGLQLRIHCDLSNTVGVQSLTIGKEVPYNNNNNYYGTRNQWGGYNAYPSSPQQQDLAVIGYNDQISNYGGSGIGVDGHLDNSRQVAYLAVTLHNVSCDAGTSFYCRGLTTYYGQTTASLNVSVCGKSPSTAVRYPDLSDPMRFAFRCDIKEGPPSAILSVTSLRLEGNGKRAAVTATGLASDFGNSVEVTGHLNTSDPVQSFLEADFTQGTCADIVEYTCTIVYSYARPDGTTGKASVTASASPPNVCNSVCAQGTVENGHAVFETDLALRCTASISDFYRPGNGCSGSTFLSSTLGLLTSQGEDLVAYYDPQTGSNPAVTALYNRGLVNVVTNPGVSVQVAYTFKGASCLDRGRTYRCKNVFFDRSNGSTTVFVSELEVPPCSPGAKVTTSGNNVTCAADPAKVAKVTSGLSYPMAAVTPILKELHLSLITEQGRQGLALLNPYINRGLPIVQSRDTVSDVTGHLDPSDPAASRLTLTLDDSLVGQGHTVVSCLAVFAAEGGQVEKAFSDVVV